MLLKHSPPLPRRNKKLTHRILTKSPSLEEILEDVCRCFGQEVEKVKSISQSNKYIIPRRIFFYLAHVLTNESCDNISSLVNRNHATYLDRVSQCFGWFEINEPNFIEDWNIYISKSEVWREYYLLKKQAIIDTHSQCNNKIREEAKYWKRQIKQAKAQKIKWKKQFTIAAKDRDVIEIVKAKSNIDKYSSRLRQGKRSLLSLKTSI
jgi:hypothetical protein